MYNAWNLVPTYVQPEEASVDTAPQKTFFEVQAPWHSGTMTHTLDSTLGLDELRWADLWKVSKPMLALFLGWTVGITTGVLGLIWFLR
jgi:hypothetical protein